MALDILRFSTVVYLMLFGGHSYAATLSVFTGDDLVKVRPSDASGSSTSVEMMSGRLSYGSGQIIARCSEVSSSTTCTGVDLTLPDLVMAGGPALTVASTTNTTPVQLNFSSSHGLSNQSMLRISGTGIGALDGNTYYITVVDTDSVTLNGTTAPGSTSSAGSATHAIHKNNIVAYRSDTMYVFTPTMPPTLTATGEFPWLLIPGYVGTEKKDPYLMETRTVFPVDIPTVGKVYREYYPMPNVQHASNANNPHNLLTNGEIGKSLSGWTLSTSGTGTTPAFAITGTDGYVSLPGGGAGTSKIEQCITTQAGWWYTLYYQRIGGTVSMQVGSSSGASNLLAKTSAAASGQADFAGIDGAACVQIFGENNTAQARRIQLVRTRTRDWSLFANPTSSGWTDVSSGGVVTHTTNTNGQVTFNGSGGTAALETMFTAEANTTYVLYVSGNGLKAQVGTTSGGTDVMGLTTVANESFIAFSTGATSGTLYLRILNNLASSITASNIYLTTPLSTGRISTSGTYSTSSRKQYWIEITRSGGAATSPVGQFQWSDDNGATWSANTNIAASVSLSNGLSAVFTGNFFDGERVTWVADSVRNQPFWVDVYVDDSVLPGVYQGTAVVVGSSPVASIDVPISITVMPVTIPAENTYARSLFSISESILPTVHGVASTEKKNLHILYSKACLRNHLTCGSNLGRYPGWSWNASTGAISSMITNFNEVNEIGRLMMDGVDTYPSLGMYTAPKGSKWSTFLYPNQPSGVNQPVSGISATAYDASTLNLTKLTNAMEDASFGFIPKVLKCTLACDATYGHDDWSVVSPDRLLYYGVDEPSLNEGVGSAESLSGEAIRETWQNFLSVLSVRPLYFTTKRLIRPTAGDGALYGLIGMWIPIGADATRGIGKPDGSFASTGVYATRQDYFDSGVTALGVYDACWTNNCTMANGTNDIDNYSAYVNSANAGESGLSYSDGLSRYTVDEENYITQLWGWMVWHWGRPNYYLYYQTVDSLVNAYGCFNGSGGYTSRGQKNVGDCLGYTETAHMFSGAGDASFLFPGLPSSWGGTNGFVIETYQLKALRNSIRDVTLLSMAYENSRDQGTQVYNTIEKTVQSSTKQFARGNPGAVRSQVMELFTLASRNGIGVNAPRTVPGAYPR